MRRPGIAVFGVLAVFSSSGIAQAAPSRITSVPVDRVQVLDGGYERVSGTLRGNVSGTERVRGLPPAGLTYAADYEIIRPARGPSVRLLLVESENRGSPVVLNALSGGSASGGPRSAVYARSVSRFLRAERLAYARVQWQTGFAAGVPASAQGVGEVIVRDFGRYLARRYPRRALVGVSQGAFFVNTFIAEGFNALARGRAYSQALTVDGNGNWMAINRLAGSGPQDPYLRRNGRPLSYRRLLRRPRTDPLLVDVANYTDFYRLRAGLTSTKPPPAGARRYDWPSPHQSFPPSAVFGGLGCNGREPIPLSPLRNRPYLRALVRGMALGRLPASRRFALGRAPRTSPGFNGLPGVRVRVPRTDRLSQPIGGVRFPSCACPSGV